MHMIFASFSVVALLCVGQPAANAAPLSIDEVIERYIEAIGGYNNIKALRNLVYSGGTYQEGNYKISHATMSLARPYYKLVGNKDEPGAFMEGYDGAAWEWFEDPGVVIRTVGPASEAIRHYAGVEGPLIDYREKGASAKIKGETEFEGRAVIVIHLTRRDGFIEQIYIDKETFFIAASGADAPIHAFGDLV